MAVIEDEWGCHLCIEKDRNRVRVRIRRSLVMVTGDRIGVVPYCSHLGLREMLSLVRLFSSSPTVNNER